FQCPSGSANNLRFDPTIVFTADSEFEGWPAKLNYCIETIASCVEEIETILLPAADTFWIDGIRWWLWPPAVPLSGELLPRNRLLAYSYRTDLVEELAFSFDLRQCDASTVHEAQEILNTGNALGPNLTRLLVDFCLERNNDQRACFFEPDDAQSGEFWRSWL